MIRSGRRIVAALITMIVMAGLVVMGVPSAAAAPGPPQYPAYWFDQWGVNQLWDRGIQGAGVVVAVLDTGVQASVPELAGSVLSGLDLTGFGGDGEVDRSTEVFSHGTAMASLIVAHGSPNQYVVGVAPDAKILPIALPLDGAKQSNPPPDAIPQAIRYAADHGANIINMSFGGERNQSDSSAPCPVDTQAAIFYALRKGLIVVASGGNSGLTGSPTEEPSVCLGVVSVGAIDQADQRAGFSSTHRYLSVSAPGQNVATLNNQDQVYVGSGTSQAAALTSGALALIWSAHRTETNRQVLAQLFAGLRDLGVPGDDRLYGYGAVNASASVAAATTGPNPVFTGADPFIQELSETPAPLPTPTAAGSAPAGSAPAGSAPAGSAPAGSATGPGAYRRDRPPAGVAPVTLGAAAVALVALIGLIATLIGTRRRRAATDLDAYALP